MPVKIFTPPSVEQAIENNGQSQERPNMDRFYPKNIRKTYRKVVVALSTITKIAKGVPLVNRGGQSIPIGTGSGQYDYIAMPPVDVEDTVPVADINDLEGATGQEVQDFVDDEVMFVQDTVGLTADALSAISMRGKIEYPIKTDNGLETFKIEFGDTLSYTVEKKWDLETTTLADILKDLLAMRALLRKAGYGSKIRWDIGLALYSALLSKITALSNDSRIEAKAVDGAIMLGGFKLELNTDTYYDPATKTDKNTVGDKEIMAWSEAAPRKFFYVKLDVADKAWARLPVYIKMKLNNKEDAYTIFGMAKPLPVPVPQSICWASNVTS